MSQKDPSDQKPATRAVTAGRREEWTGPVVNPPVWRASTHLYDNVAALRAGPKANEDGRFFYGRRGSPTQWSLADALTAMEPGAHGTMLYPSGVAAIAGSLLADLSPGDVLLMSDNSYDPSRGMADTLLKRLGVQTRYFDPLIGAGISDLICDKTRAIWMESPGSLTFEVSDIPAICAAAKQVNPKIATLLDNTWATSHFFTAIEKGVDLVMNAATKYIVGHSDVMMGAVTANERHWWRLRRTAQSLGHIVSPDDAYLAARGLRTLDVRLERHQQSALTVAHWLTEQPEVAHVLHPALPSCPGHDIWARDFTGSSGLFSFVLKGGSGEARDALVDALSLFGIGYSWGGYESLAIPADPAPNRSATPWPPADYDPADKYVVRLQIGLEDADDLIADLATGLEAFRLAQ
ncbi:cystathionine beta-lyase [Alterisphingorhabdus coralli]|uniref:Cystathionine beta-lyase n=1 Tax=Alterisphingorhabdus coralli TaxID=3071408 RepID=A0AA97F8B9_9SPHN|nr:cystathionine beta-lyase [Parasphingorhabdus sp. SCSIO 66989]WOE76209.1 cystathionine beta-lyase [Parasphingorhabdus sp. SCSIO 66989]